MRPRTMSHRAGNQEITPTFSHYHTTIKGIANAAHLHRSEAWCHINNLLVLCRPRPQFAEDEGQHHMLPMQSCNNFYNLAGYIQEF